MVHELPVIDVEKMWSCWYFENCDSTGAKKPEDLSNRGGIVFDMLKNIQQDQRVKRLRRKWASYEIKLNERGIRHRASQMLQRTANIVRSDDISLRHLTF